MAKKWTIELYYFVGTLILALALYFLRPKFQPDNFAEQLIGHSLTTTLTIFVFGQIWAILYFLTNAFRQLWLRFSNRLTNLILLTTSIIVIFLLIFWNRLINEQGSEFTEEGFVIYPPLSSFTETEYSLKMKLQVTRILWASEILVAFIAGIALVRTIKRPGTHS